MSIRLPVFADVLEMKVDNILSVFPEFAVSSFVELRCFVVYFSLCSGYSMVVSRS